MSRLNLVPTARTRELDGIRGLAISLVIIFHYLHLPSAPQPKSLWGWANMLFRVTWSGVDLFFVLSGFLIGGILLLHRDSPNFFRVFYARRICRICPLYYSFLLLGWLLARWESHRHLTLAGPLFQQQAGWLNYVTYTQNLAFAWQGGFVGGAAFNITWSLAIEEQFYLLAPLLVRSTRRSWLPWVLLGLMLLGLLTRATLFLLWPGRGPLWCYLLLPCRWDPLLLGMLAACWAQEGFTVRRPFPTAGALKACFALLGAGWLAAAITACGVIMSPYVTVVGYTWVGLLYFTGVLLVTREPDTGLVKLLRTPWLCQLGLISYGVYLLHEPMNALLHQMLLGRPPRFSSGEEAVTTLAALAITVTVASLSWAAFEKPIIQWSHRRFVFAPPQPALPVRTP